MGSRFHLLQGDGRKVRESRLGRLFDGREEGAGRQVRGRAPDQGLEVQSVIVTTSYSPGRGKMP